MGFVTWMNGPLISFVRVAFDLSDTSALLVPMVFYFSYFLFSLPASFLARKLGLRTGLSVSLLLCAAGVALFGQFIAMRLYGGALTGLLVMGAGLSQIYVALKPVLGFQAMFALLVLPSYLALLLYARRYGQTGLLPLDQEP